MVLFLLLLLLLVTSFNQQEQAGRIMAIAVHGKEAKSHQSMGQQAY